MSRPASWDAIVIGGGLNGLTAATALARAGRRTLVLERRQIAGGTATTEEFAPGFRADGTLHDVGWLAPPVADLMGLGRFELVRPDPQAIVPLPDGGVFTLPAAPREAVEAIRRFSAADAAAWEEFCAGMDRLAGFLATIALAPAPRPLDLSPGNLVPLLSLGRRVRGLGRAGMIDLLRIVPMSAAELLSDRFECEPLKGAVAAAGLAHLFQGPRAGGTAFTLLHHHMGAGAGRFRGRGFVRGGAGVLADAFAAAARAAGAEIRFSAEVAAIRLAGGRLRGVALAGGDEIDAPAVLSSVDPRRTLLGMVPAEALDPELARSVSHIKCRGVMVKVRLALAEAPRLRGAAGGELPAGILSLTPDLDTMERAYDDAKHGGISRRPVVEAFLPTRLDPSLAPAGRHVLTAWGQFAPYRLSEGGWDAGRREAAGDAIVAALAEAAPNIPGAILHRQVLTPVDLENRLGAPEGNLYQGEMTLDQILFMRPVGGWARHETPVDGLWLCGTGTHPGGGLPGAAGMLGARAALRAARRSPSVRTDAR